jgi:hypothetical protein
MLGLIGRAWPGILGFTSSKRSGTVLPKVDRLTREGKQCRANFFFGLSFLLDFTASSNVTSFYLVARLLK